MRSNYKNGYIGMVALIIAIAIISFLMVKMLQREYGVTEDSTNVNEGAIQAAEEARNLIESRNFTE